MTALVGAIAAGVAVASLALTPLASFGVPRPRHPEGALLRAAGWTRPSWPWEALRAALVAGTLALAWPLGVPQLAAAAAALPSLVLRARVSARRSAAARGAVTLLQTAQASLRTGATMAQAVRAASDAADGVLREPFALALRSFELNGALEAALRAAARSAWDRRVGFALEALALVAAEQLPAARAAAIVGAAADRLAYEQRLAEEVVARTAGIRAQIVLLALLVPVLALYLAITLPGLGATLTSPIGLFVLLPGAAVFEIAGIVASRAIVSAVER